MNKEEYYKRLEKTTEKIKTDRCSEDEIANINRQKLYLAEHYISSLEQENKKYKEVFDKAIKFTNKNWGTWCTHHLEYMTELQNILKEVSE